MNVGCLNWWSSIPYIVTDRLTARYGSEWAHNLFIAANDFVGGTWRRYSFESGYSSFDHYCKRFGIRDFSPLVGSGKYG